MVSILRNRTVIAPETYNQRIAPEHTSSHGIIPVLPLFCEVLVLKTINKLLSDEMKHRIN